MADPNLPPIPPPPPPAAPTRDAMELRLAALRAEAEAAPSTRAQAILHDEIGRVYEESLKNDAEAVRSYLAAYNADPTFRPPLLALLRVFERRRSFKNLERLYEAEHRSALTDAQRSQALVDRAILLEDHLGREEEALAIFEEALDADPSSAIATWMLERGGRRTRSKEISRRALEARLRLTRDPTMRALLLGEVALELEGDGKVDDAITTLREAAALPAARWRSLVALERLARRHKRPDALVAALEARAELAAGVTPSGALEHGSGAFSIERFEDETRAHGLAAALYFEAAHLRRTHLADAEGAQKALEAAIRLRPSDVLFREEHMLAAEIAGDHAAAAEDATYLLERGASGSFAASLHFRQAERAKAAEDVDDARRALEAAILAAPTSAVASGLLDDLLLDENEHAARVERATSRAKTVEGEKRAQHLWRAAQIYATRIGDFERAAPLYRDAAKSSQNPGSIWRELYGAALRHGAPDAAAEACTALLATELAPEERAAVTRERFVLLRDLDPAASRAALLEALDDPAARRWAPEAARLEAARGGDFELLAKAHRAIASVAGEPEAAAAHLCAAARAAMRHGGSDVAVAALREAIDRVPGHRYAIALLEEVLRSRGEADEVVSLLRRAAEAQQGARAAEIALLLAGAAAEAADDPALAARTYEEAADRDHTAVGPLFSLRRLAERTGDHAMLLHAREALSEREIAQGEPGRATFALAEHYDLLSGKPELAEAPLRAVLDDEVVGLAAAASLVFQPERTVDARLRARALDRLSASLDATIARGFQQATAIELLADDQDLAGALEVATKLLESEPDDAVAALVQRRARAAGLGDPEARGQSWVDLGRATTDRAAGAELLLHGARVLLATRGSAATEDAFLLAQEVAEAAPGTVAAAVAADETLSASDDAEVRADATAARRAHTTPGLRPPIDAALGRTLGAAGRTEEAIETLKRVVTQEPGDLASWEALRVAAREGERWDVVVDACDRLAKLVDGALRADLLEEAGAVAMDHLDDDAGAEKRFRDAIAIGIDRTVAFYRLHDVLANRDDNRALVPLVCARIEAVDGDEELTKLYYELARLLRASGDRDGALAALSNLFLLDEEHAGGIALAVEIHVSRESYRDAVAALRRLATADVPAAQRRIARLGAADFLEKKLEDHPGALEELQAIESLGLGDAALYSRMADLAERCGKVEVAAAALDKAIASSTGAQRAAHARRAGWLRVNRLGDAKGGRGAFRIALAEEPTDLESADAISNLLEDPREVLQHSEAFEKAVRAEMETRPVESELIRKLRQAATWRGQGDLEHLAISGLLALGHATQDEVQWEDEHTEIIHRAGLKGELPDTLLPLLRAPEDGGAAAEIAYLCGEHVAAIDGHDVTRHGVGKKDLVSPKVEHAVRLQLQTIVGVFGIGLGDFYVGGTEPRRSLAIPTRPDSLTWIVGPSVDVPLEPLVRFHVARQAAAHRFGTLSFVQRSPVDATTLLFACCEASEAPLPAGAGRPSLTEWSRALSRELPRRVRKAVAELAPQVEAGGAKLEAYCRGARLTTLRAGMLLAGDLTTALAVVLGSSPTPALIAASPDATDLLRFWTSAEHLALRRELGVSK